MVNISNSFILYIKKAFKINQLSLEDYVICFICKKNSNEEYVLDYVIQPLYLFNNDNEKIMLKMKHPSLYKKSGCWFASDVNSFFFLISKKISIDRKGNFKLLKTSVNGKNSLIYFIGSCLKEHAINEKMSHKELAVSLNITQHQLKSIFKGTFSKFDISHLTSVNREFEGRNNTKKRFVILEKISKETEKDFIDDDFDE